MDALRFKVLGVGFRAFGCQCGGSWQGPQTTPPNIQAFACVETLNPKP